MKSLCARKDSSAGTVMRLDVLAVGPGARRRPRRCENDAGGLGVAQRFRGRHLHRLLLEHELALQSPVSASAANATTSRPTRRAGPSARHTGGSSLRLAAQVPGGDARRGTRRPRRTRPRRCAGTRPARCCWSAPPRSRSAAAGRRTSSTPTGCCIHELAARMKYALTDAWPARTPTRRPGAPSSGSRSQPKIHSPRKVDSTKNATSPSMASGAPNTSPTNRE